MDLLKKLGEAAQQRVAAELQDFAAEAEKAEEWKRSAVAGPPACSTGRGRAS